MLETLEQLHVQDELTDSHVQCKYIGLTADMRDGYMEAFSLHHEGSAAETAGYPYYRQDCFKISVVDSYLAAVVSFVFFLAPHLCQNLTQ